MDRDDENGGNDDRPRATPSVDDFPLITQLRIRPHNWADGASTADTDYPAQIVNESGGLYFRAKGCVVPITPSEAVRVMANPNLHYFSDALKLHQRIEAAFQAEGKKKELWYRHAENESLVFATPDEALRIHAIRHALSEARTWGEFRRLMPEEDFSEVTERMREYSGDEEDPVGQENDPFDSSVVPGYCDGDYPEWLQASAQRFLPKELLSRYGAAVTTFLNGNYWSIDPERAGEMIEELKGMGYDVTERDDLGFF